jgi:hypothetical protein
MRCTATCSNDSRDAETEPDQAASAWHRPRLGVEPEDCDGRSDRQCRGRPIDARQPSAHGPLFCRTSMGRGAALDDAEDDRANESNREIGGKKAQSAGEGHGGVSLRSTHAAHQPLSKDLDPENLAASPTKKTAVLNRSRSPLRPGAIWPGQYGKIPVKLPR